MATERPRVTDEQLVRAVREARTFRQVLLFLGVSAEGGNYAYFWHRIRRAGFDTSHFHTRRRPIVIDDEQLRHAVAAAVSMSEVIRALGFDPTGHGSKPIRRRIRELGLDVSHLGGWRQHAGAWRVPIEEYLVASGRNISSAKLKRRLILEGLLPRCCDVCREDTWLGAPIPLELDHRNGDNRDNRLENLRLLCPNCHALTPTYRGRNIGRRCA